MKPDLSEHDLLVVLLTLHNAIQRRGDVFFQDYGLTDAQFNILNLIGLAGGPLDQLALTERLLVGKSSVSIVLNRMVKAGLIQRGEHARDRRRVVLTLTRKGRELWRKIAPRYEEGVREIFSALPRKRREAFLADIEAVYAALKRSVGDKSSSTLRDVLRQHGELV
jgi:MarR family 2-MHQ and catechol resistance regulon transcriptional repressor